MARTLSNWSAPGDMADAFAAGAGVQESLSRAERSMADFLSKQGVSPAHAKEMVRLFAKQVAEELAKGLPPHQAIEAAKAHVPLPNPPPKTESPTAELLEALSRGGPVDGVLAKVLKAESLSGDKGKAFATALETALKQGKSMDQALAGAKSAAEHHPVGEQGGDAAAKLMAALSGGAEANGVVAAMLSGRSAGEAQALLTGLQHSLSRGAPMDLALTRAQEGAVKATAAEQAAHVSLSSADQLALALAEGRGGGVSEAMAAALAAGQSPTAAAVAAFQAGQRADILAQTQQVPVSAADVLAQALASGGALAVTPQLAAFTQSLGWGEAADTALVRAVAVIQAHHNQDQAAENAVSPADQLIAALARGSDVQNVLAGTSVSFATALQNALARGNDGDIAFAHAAAAAHAADQQAGVGILIPADTPSTPIPAAPPSNPVVPAENVPHTALLPTAPVAASPYVASTAYSILSVDTTPLFVPLNEPQAAPSMQNLLQSAGPVQSSVVAETVAPPPAALAPVQHAAPSISLSSSTLTLDEDCGATPLTVGLGADEGVTLSISVDNAALFPGGGYVLSGSGASRILTLTPAANASGTAILTLTAEGGGATTASTLTVNVQSVADAPTVTPANGGGTVVMNTQSTSGLVIGRNGVDGADIAWFKISAITGGTLFQHDGTTAIANNGYITYAEAQAGLKFTATAGSASFAVQGATDSAGHGLGAATAISLTVQGAVSAADDGAEAVEAGYNVGGSNALGNVLANDEESAGAALTITAFRTGNVEGGGTAGTVGGAALTGSYGSLTLAADGSYTYAVNNANATVNALESGQSLHDYFNYTASNGAVSDRGVLDITIQGAADQGWSTVSTVGSGISGDFTVLDVDNDGKQDLVGGSSSLILVYGQGAAGAFSLLQSITPSSNSAYGLAHGDLNGDGSQDLLSAGPNGSSLSPNSVYLNSGGTFGAGTTIYTSNSTFFYGQDVTIGNLNGDSHLDVVWNTGDGVRVAFGNGSGGFSSITTLTPSYASIWSYDGVQIFDAKGDGSADDIMVSTYANASAASVKAVDIFLNNGSGVFTKQSITGADLAGLYDNVNALGAATGDFNGDGRTDIAFFNFAQSGGVTAPGIVVGLRTSSDGATPAYSFSKAVAFGDGTFFNSLRSLDAADVNGDGHLDLIATSSSGGKIFAGDGLGGFSLQGSLGTGNYARQVVADVNSDGKADVVYGSGSTLDVYYQMAGNGNYAPTLSGTYAFAATDQNTSTAGVQVSTIIGGLNYADANTGAAQGIAVTAESGNGTWEFSTDNGTWTAFGAVSSGSALLLSAGTYVRYVPDHSAGENVGLTFRAWDQSAGSASANGAPSHYDTSGNGGTSAFSANNAAATLTVNCLADPLVLDLNGDGVHLTAVNAATSFDMNGDGRAEASGWISPGDALLVWDRDQDGRISGIGEVLSDHGASGSLLALGALDDNGDGRIDGQDAAYARLLVWSDADGDGRSLPQELSSLAQAGIAALLLQRLDSVPRSDHGNTVTASAAFQRADGSMGEMAEVAFAYAPPAEGHELSSSHDMSAAASLSAVDDHSSLVHAA